MPNSSDYGTAVLRWWPGKEEASRTEEDNNNESIQADKIRIIKLFTKRSYLEPNQIVCEEERTSSPLK